MGLVGLKNEEEETEPKILLQIAYCGLGIGRKKVFIINRGSPK